MAAIQTIEVVIERVITQHAKVSWDINVPEFEEWYGQSIERATPDVFASYIESSRYRDDEIRDHAESARKWREDDRETKVHKVILT